MSEDKMPNVIYLADADEDLEHSHEPSSHWTNKYYSESHVQHLIDQAKDEQREDCLKAALSQCNTKRFFDRDYLVECGDIRHAILTATEDK